MSSLAQVHIHRSQWPEQVQRDLLDSLRSRQVNHKFHYDSVKQTQKWLALHEAFSPARIDPDCADAYDRGFIEAAARVPSGPVHLVGLGCGGGQKDARLLKVLRDAGHEVRYTPVDVSTAMVLVARRTALSVLPETACFPLVCDLATTTDPAAALAQASPVLQAGAPRWARLVTFFGMLPNFEPQHILPLLAELIVPGEFLLLSANLAPGLDYELGLQRVRPQYDNDLTRDWLMSFLTDLGVELADGELRFVIEESPVRNGLKRLAAYFHFLRARKLVIDGEVFQFQRGDSVRLFFSYRHTPARVRALLQQHGLAAEAEWLTRSEEEGVFLARRLS